MTNKWQTTTLEQFAFIEMGQSPSGETCNQRGIGLPLLNGPTEFGNYHPTPIQFTNDPSKYAYPNDILFCVRGSTTGRMNWADQKYAIGRGIAALRHRSGSEYRYYLKAIIDYRLPELLAMATGSTFPNISREQLANLKCEIPSLPEQLAIARVLGALDDKIELNRRMNCTLEMIIKNIFHQWFIENELSIDWKEKKLGEVADVNWGDTNTTKKSYVDKGYPAYSAKGQDGYLPYYDFDRTGIVVSAIGANAGATWLALGKWSCIKNTLRFWSTSDDINTEYLFYATLGNDKWPLRGSAQPFIAQTDARDMRICMPPQNLTLRFADYVRPMINLCYCNEIESRTLANLRDTLLPKLMRGEVKI